MDARDWLQLEIDEVDRQEDGITLEAIASSFLIGLGGGGSPVKPMANAFEFVTHYQLTMDGEPLYGPTGLEGDYRHLRDLYEDTHRVISAMMSAQSGKSAWLMTHMGRNAVGPAYGKRIGYYFPDLHLPREFSTRFKGFLKSNMTLAQLLGAVTKTGAQKQKGRDAILSMNIAETMLNLMTIGGKTATEGLPLFATYFDEVRRMDVHDIERAQERYSGQRGYFDVKVSTAKYPEGDIHHFFLMGDQRYFHTACECPDGVVLSTSFPDCLADLSSATPELLRRVRHAFAHAGLPYLGLVGEEAEQYPPAAYVCPKCGTVIVDPREGWWEPHAPNNWSHSYQLGQMLSPKWPAGRLLYAHRTNTDQQEFMNSKLGLPWVDRQRMPVQAEHIDACVDDSLQWGEHVTDAERIRRFGKCGLGLDVQAGYGICVIKKRAPNGKFRTVHVEVCRSVEGAEDGKGLWWYRVAQLMQRYDVSVAVVDEAPEYTQSLAFAQNFPGRAFLANYALGDNAPRFVAWEDEQLGDDEKQKGETAIRHRVSLHRTRALHWSLMRWRERSNEVPKLQTLTQRLKLQDGKPVFSAHLRAGVEGVASPALVMRDHLTRFVFRDVLEDDPEKAKIGKRKIVAEHIGGSPDFAHADLYASIALDRIGTPLTVRGLR